MRSRAMRTDIVGRSAAATLAVVTVLAAFGSAPSFSWGREGEAPEGEAASVWSGQLAREFDGPITFTYPVIVTVRAAPTGGLEGTIRCSSWGDRAWPLYRVRRGGGRVGFSIDPAGKTGWFTATEDAQGHWAGTYEWRGTTHGFAASPGRVAFTGADRPARVPSPPLPYATEPVTFASGDIRIGGGLTRPNGPGLAPAVVIVGGSGRAAECDPQIPGLPGADAAAWVLTDALCRAGVATLCLDDRGVGASGGVKLRSTLDQLAGDVEAAVAFLSARDGIDKGRIGLLGWSQGGLVAALAAGRRPDVRYLVLVATPAVHAAESFLDQTKNLRRLAEIEPDRPSMPLDAELRIKATLFRLAGDPRLSDDQVAARTREFVASIDPAGTLSARRVGHIIREGITPMMRSHLALGPDECLAKIKIPTLAVAGDNDPRVDGPNNLVAIAGAMRGNPGLTTKLLPGLDHGLARDATGRDVREAIDPTALDAIVGWVADQMGLGARGRR